MSVTLDTNILVYASDTSSSRQPRASQLVEDLANGSTLVTLFWPVLLGYLRISTHPRLFRHPVPIESAIANIEDLTARPNVHVVGETDGFLAIFRKVAEPVRPAGNLIPDTHLVTLMRQHEIRDIWTHDRDFRKFDQIEMHDPFS